MGRPKVREIVLGLALAAVALYWWGSGGTKSGAGPGAGEAADQEEGIPGADLALLIDPNAELPSLRDSLRNLFNYSRSPEEIAAELAEQERLRKLREEAERRRREEEMRRRDEAEKNRPIGPDLPPPPLPPPPINLTFIGYLGEPTEVQRRLVVFAASGSGGDVYVARRGEVVADKFKVIDIDFESVTVGYVNPEWKDRTRTLRMGG
jgi:hypothetical protein